MIKMVICDDEEIILYKLKDRIYQAFQYDCEAIEIDLFTDSKEFIANYKEKYYDLIFLDIKMPEFSGFETAEILQKNGDKTNIVFITSINDYAFDAYLNKPIGFIRKDHIDEDLAKYKSSILNVLKNNSIYYTCTTNSETYKIRISDICYFDKLRNYLNIHTVENEVIKIKRPLKSIFDEIKSDSLFQINKGIIVNIEHINKIDRYFAHTVTNEVLPVSTTFYEDFKNRFKKDI